MVMARFLCYGLSSSAELPMLLNHLALIFQNNSVVYFSKQSDEWFRAGKRILTLLPHASPRIIP
jgi:hypothetical protein